MRFHFLFILLFLFLGNNASAFSREESHSIHSVGDNVKKLLIPFSNGNAQNDRFGKSEKPIDDALLQKASGSKTIAPSAKERQGGILFFYVAVMHTAKQAFPAFIAFGFFSSRLSDFKKSLLFPKHTFW